MSPNQAQSALSCPHATENEKLKGVIGTLGCLSQEGFSKIAAIGVLILHALETPDFYRGNREVIAHAIENIVRTADDSNNCIGRKAESVDCGYENDARRRRFAALESQGKED
jgi:hypothetical protein